MEWRESAGAPEMEDLVNLANGPETAPEAVEQPEKLTKAKALAVSLNNGSLYWHGVTKDGKPVLWIRCGRKPWYPNVEAEVNALVLIADAGIKAGDLITHFGRLTAANDKDLLAMTHAVQSNMGHNIAVVVRRDSEVGTAR